jgi:hypothetical protein
MIIFSIGNTCLLGQIKQTASVSVRLYLIITLFVKMVIENIEGQGIGLKPLKKSILQKSY